MANFVQSPIISYSGRKPSSKLWVIAVLSILEKEKFNGIFAIVDADFDHLESYLEIHHIPNLLRTDTHDLETMLLNSPALDKVIAEFGSEDKIANFGRDIRTVLLADGIWIGYLRWVSLIDGLNLTFDGRLSRLCGYKVILSIRLGSWNYRVLRLALA